MIRTRRTEATTCEGRAAVVLASPDGRVRATVVPDLSMLIWSLTFDGREVLGQPASLADVADHGSTTGVPVLHPWANRLGGPQLVDVDHPTIGRSALIPRDAHDLPIHGINLAGAGWAPTTGSAGDAVWVEGTLDFSGPELLQLFPFPHRVVIRVSLSDRKLIVATGIEATGTVPVPVSFGWHPYFAIPDVPRSDWRVSLPVARHAELDMHMLPTGRSAPCDAIERALGDATYDDFFPQLRGDEPEFLLRGGEWTVRVTFGPGYPVAQVYAPADRDVVAYEPMTAPVAALTTGEGLRRIAPGERFEAGFRIGVERRAL